MSTAEILSMVSKITYVIAGVSFVLALFFWFRFNIPSVISDLSGRTARKSIAEIRAHNEKQQGKKKDGATNRAPAEKREKRVTSAKPAQSRPQTADDDRPETALLADNKATRPLEDETVMLDEGESTCLLGDEEATVLLVEHGAAPAYRPKGKQMTMLDEVMLIHTDEVIL